MHYSDGTEAKLGDVVKFKRYSARQKTQVSAAGVLVTATPGTCNGMVRGIRSGMTEDGDAVAELDAAPSCVTIGECSLLLRPGANADQLPADALKAEAAPAQA